MNYLLTSTAIDFVRKSLDELFDQDNPIEIFDDMDSNQFEAVVSKTIAEAVNMVHLLAPVHRLEGESVSLHFNEAKVDKTGMVLEFTPNVDDFLRLVRFQTIDAKKAVYEVTPENSAEGMAQENPYTCGTWVSPRLVQLVGTTTTPTFRYYSVAPGTDIEMKGGLHLIGAPASLSYKVGEEDYIKAFYYIQKQGYHEAKEGEEEAKYSIASGLETAAMNYLVGLVLQIYKQVDLAQVFITRATELLQA